MGRNVSRAMAPFVSLCDIIRELKGSQSAQSPTA
jgi:hypothetical protein